jgi:hypothetical protein
MSEKFNKDEFILETNNFLDEIRAKEEERKNKPIFIRLFLDVCDFIYYRIICKIPSFIQKVIFKSQELINGYSEYDVYNLGSFVFRKTYKPLKKFVKYYEEHGMYLPDEFETDPASWLAILKKIEFAFDSEWSSRHEVQNRYIKGKTEEEIKEHNLKVEEGFTLFGKYMRDIFD